MKLALQVLLLSVGLSPCAATPHPEAERLAVVATRVEAGCRTVEDGAAQPNPQPSVRQLTSAALGWLELGQPAERAEKLVRHAFGLQDLDPASPGYGTVPWQPGHPEIKDPSAIQFTLQPVSEILLRHNARLSESLKQDAPLNTLTESEKAAGWRLLWDGKTSAGWRNVKSETFPDKEWEMAGGILSVRAASDPLSVGRGSIITRERFASFELVADFKLTPGANSGIKYFVQSNLDPENQTGAGPSVGCEFQILDDERHPDAKLGRAGNRTLGSLYDLIPPAASKQSNPVGEWNTARILVQGRHVEHWLNGQKVVAYERGSTAFRAAVAQSKFKNIPAFGEWPEGHILLQEHGDQVHFRNLKIRVLPAR